MKAFAICLYFFIFLFILLPKSFAEGSIKINEFLAHPSSGNKEWIEFYNPDNIDISSYSSYWIDDDRDFNNDAGSSPKKNLSSLNTDGSAFLYFETSSFLNNDGDYVVLFSPTGEIIDEYQYTEDPGVDVSIGRSPDGVGGMAVMSSSTKGKSNSFFAPTDTPTPAPTQKPTPTSKPTPTTKATPTAKTTNSKSPTQNPTFLTSSMPSSQKLAGESGKALITEIENMPTSVLGEGTQAATKTSVKEDVNPKETKVLGSRGNNIAKILIGIGVVFLIICGILVFLAFRKGLLTTDRDE